MRILIITPWFPAYPDDQTGNYIFASITTLLKLGHTIKVLVTSPWRPPYASLLHSDWRKTKIATDRFSGDLGIEIIEYISIPRNYCRILSNYLYQHRVVPALDRIIEYYKPDIIHAHTELPGYAAVISGRKNGKPVVVTLHGLNTAERLQSGAQRRMCRKLANFADRLIIVGPPLAEYAKSLSGRSEHIRIVPNGFSLPAGCTRPQRRPWPDVLNLISISNLHEGKGVDLTLKALNLLARDGITNWHYTVVGDGKERTHLESLAEDMHLSHKVTFSGQATHFRVYQMLMKAHVFVLPSYREAFGIAYLEAMACGLLTIGVEGQGPAAFIQNECTGLLVLPGNIDSLTKNLGKVFLEPGTMQEIALAGQEYVFNHFTWEHHARKLDDLYREIVQ